MVTTINFNIFVREYRHISILPKFIAVRVSGTALRDSNDIKDLMERAKQQKKLDEMMK